ncbi:MAG: THUMP domain-containing protein [Sulfurisoma sp.]|nr:THUMP domain-containing protein [Sulfurisoma sp.]
MTLQRFFSPCPRGLEALLAEDVAAAGARDIEEVPGGVGFGGSWETGYRVNLESRIATRVLWRVAGADNASASADSSNGRSLAGWTPEGRHYRSEDDIYRLARQVEWPRLFEVRRSIRVHVTAVRSPLKSLEFATLRVKDAVCDCFRDAVGERPNVSAEPDIRIHLFLTADKATLYVDTSGEALWQRGHKLAKVAAPLKENLAAGILRLSGWKPGVPLLDPMCGSGTFLLEAAGMALGDAPGLSRDEGDFGFARLKGYDAALWRRLRLDAAARRSAAVSPLPIFGSDLSDDAVARARQNLAHAGIDDLVTVERADLLLRSAPAASGVLVANPPYGERLGEADELAAFYPRLGDALKKNFAGWDCWFLSADTRLPKLIGLKPRRKIPLFNGPLECRLYGFDIVAGQHR